MSKISLLEAKKIVENIEVKDTFASLINKTVAEDQLKLYTYEILCEKIFVAERYFNLDALYNQINCLKRKEQYYAPCNAVFYYKEGITAEDKLTNRIIWLDIISQFELLEDKIESISEHIYIEVD